MKNADYPLLFSPTQIAGLELKNRIVMPAMGMNMSAGGLVNEAVINHYAERAKGGAGLIVVEVTCVDTPLGLNTLDMLAIDDDRYIPGMKRLTEAIHAHGARCVLQISHTGRGAKRQNIGGQPVGPSAVPMPYAMIIGMSGEIPRELTATEIREIEDKYAAAALRAKEAGFDGVEVHATGYYLVAQFLSSAANHRSDQYGGTPRKRATFALNILHKIKQLCGDDFPVIYKLSMLELGKNGGIKLGDGLLYARLLQEAGADALEILAMSYKQTPTLRDVPDTAQNKGLTFPLSKLLKLSRVPGKAQKPNLLIGRKAVTIPLIAGGRTFEPDLAEQALAKGKSDLVFMGRGLLAEPHLPELMAKGQFDLARPCIGCGRCVDNQLQNQTHALCSGNPVLGTGDNDYSLPPAATKKRVLVIGAGPAGMEAARIAALRGHDVTLLEQSSRTGGQLHHAVKPPHKKNLEPLITYYDRQLAHTGVHLELNTPATAEEILSRNPDTLILATGVSPVRLPIPGFDLPHVINAKEALAGAGTGRRVVIIGGGLVGAETAEFLLKQKKQVTIVEMLPELATKMVAAHRTIILGHLKLRGVTTCLKATCREITPDTVIITTGDDTTSLPADTVIIATGDTPETTLYDQLKDQLPCHLIGDARQPEGIAESVRAGYYTALEI